jgi:hypothetical protein
VARQGAKMLGPAQIAASASTKKSMKINYLQRYDKAMTVISPRKALSGAAVEF